MTASQRTTDRLSLSLSLSHSVDIYIRDQPFFLRSDTDTVTTELFSSVFADADFLAPIVGADSAFAASIYILKMAQ